MSAFDSENFLKSVSSRSGVYRMHDKQGEIIYVGKAKNLKKRLSSYFRKTGLTPKVASMVKQIDSIDVVITHTEGEALLLENNLIKKFKPRYNILLRDDKSFPYLFLSDEKFPRLVFHRGARNKQGEYFGPFASVPAVRESLNLLQKLFPVRQCEDSYYKNRTRPCLQYQINRCSAPCVDLITTDEYQQDVRHTRMFLQGKHNDVIDELVKQMEQSSNKLEFEKAARLRDQIINLRRIQEKQFVVSGRGDLDVVVVVKKGGISCVQIFVIRAGQNLGNKTIYPKHTEDHSLSEILSATIAQYYLVDTHGDKRHIPGEIIINEKLNDKKLLEEVLCSKSGSKIIITSSVRGDRARWVKMAQMNATQSLLNQLARKESYTKRLETLRNELSIEENIHRIECFDISHTMGEATVASCVVFENDGMKTSDYRRYNITDITPGDDYAAMDQVLRRRYERLKRDEGVYPDVVLIDGGKGQLTQAENVFNHLQIVGIVLVGVAKGVERKPGLEQLILSGQATPIILPADSGALHLIQEIRDEAHRFAITGHRHQRAKKRKRSVLEDIPGLGPKRRQMLIKQFGGLQEIIRAGTEDLVKLKGISQKMAQQIYDSLHPEKE
jgi:excinuclease ABC subunit C